MELICPHCNSRFYVTRGLLNDYVYKIDVPYNIMKRTYFCSYTCWRKTEVKYEATKDGIQISR